MENEWKWRKDEGALAVFTNAARRAKSLRAAQRQPSSQSAAAPMIPARLPSSARSTGGMNSQSPP